MTVGRRTSKSLQYLAVVLMVIITIPSAAYGLEESFVPRPTTPVVEAGFVPHPVSQARNDDVGTIDPYLQDVLQDAAPGELLEVIIQFRDELTPADIAALHDLGFRVRHHFDVVPGVLAVGTPEQVRAAAELPRAYWLEFNEQMVNLMHVTTTVTNATGVWQTYPVSKLDRWGVPYTGKGVTIAIVDTGVDAGHPDLDYGEKMIANMKSNFDGTFTDVEDGDTGSGHGTHVAGTIAGNGEASGGARSGMAKDSTMVSISTGDNLLWNVIGALEWVYSHSVPGNDPWNIRGCSNSWGSGAGEYNPQDAVTLVANRLTYENNVVTVFAAGNSGGDGSDIQSSVYGNTPAIIEVAAALHDGTGLAGFSSRGQDGLNQTYPDISAPGVDIWATQARRTSISARKNTDANDLQDAYYMAISGTSMATPHVSGLVGLMFEAAPSLGISKVHDDYASNETDWWNNTETLIHEVEYIMELTADYMTGAGIPGHDPAYAGNASNSSMHYDHPYDYGQGYGLINSTRAVALALTLEELRHEDPSTTVNDAWEHYEKLYEKVNVTYETDSLQTNWLGEWGRLNDGDTSLFTQFGRKVFIPNETGQLVIDFTYTPTDSDGWSSASLVLEIDSDGDGTDDWSSDSGFSNRGVRHHEVDASTIGQTGTVWSFTVSGVAAGIPPVRSLVQKAKNQYNEILVEYQVGLIARLKADNGTVIQLPLQQQMAEFSPWVAHDPGPDGDNASLVMEQHIWNLSRVTLQEEQQSDTQEAPGLPWWLLPLLLVAAIAAVGLAARRRIAGAMGRGPAAGASAEGEPQEGEVLEDDDDGDDVVDADAEDVDDSS